MKRFFYLSFILWGCSAIVMNSQTIGYPVNGRVIDRLSREGVPYAAVVVVGNESVGVMTDSTGYFSFEKMKPGIIGFSAIQLGYITSVTPDYIISPQTPFIEIEMDRDPSELAASYVRPSPFLRIVESPVSVRVISLGDIEKIPGANKDVSRLLRSYPGVSYSPIGYRNDLIVRGGGPSENVFFIDGIEILNINHFATQGASGGPVSILNSDLIREISFYTGSFPANRGGALSSVMDITMRDGNADKQAFKAVIGASEAGVSASGHMGEKTTYVASVRQSYLQLLFKLLGLPLLPNYIDGQFKVKIKCNPTNELSFIGLAGFDDMKLNTEPDDKGDEYLLSYLPLLKQETFTVGATYKHFSDKNIQTLALSYSYLNNRSRKFLGNDDSDPSALVLRSSSLEGKAQARFENRTFLGSWTIRSGADMSWRHYDSYAYRMLADGKPVNYDTEAGFLVWGAFGSADYKSPQGKLNLSFGLRTDGASFSKETSRFWKQFSPRASVSYLPWESWSFNASAGLYHQLPPMTALSFRDPEGNLVNGDLSYMRVLSAAAGVDWRYRDRLFIGLEGFFKKYMDLPYSIVTGVPLTCIGADYGSIGEEALVSSSEGLSYGAELLVRWLIPDKVTLVGSFTLYRSVCRSSAKDPYIPTAWDNRYIANLSAVYDLPKYWSIGVKVSTIGGAPYTPYDEEYSSLKTVWDSGGRPVPDYSRYNDMRLAPYYQIDLRVDKNFYFTKWAIGLYVDIQNITFSKISQPLTYLSTDVIINPEAPLPEQKYGLEPLELKSGTIIPAIGVTVEF